MKRFLVFDVRFRLISRLKKDQRSEVLYRFLDEAIEPHNLLFGYLSVLNYAYKGVVLSTLDYAVNEYQRMAAESWLKHSNLISNYRVGPIAELKSIPPYAWETFEKAIREIEKRRAEKEHRKCIFCRKSTEHLIKSISVSPIYICRECALLSTTMGSDEDVLVTSSDPWNFGPMAGFPARHRELIHLKKQDDPQTPISYLILVSILLHHHEDLFDLDSIFDWINPKCLSDISTMRSKIIQEMGYITFLEDKFLEQKTYQFVDQEGRRGRIELSFHDNMLVKSRLELKFQGAGAARDALNFLDHNLRPVISGCLGEDNFQYDTSTRTYSNSTALSDYIVAYGREPSFSIVSTRMRYKAFYS